MTCNVTCTVTPQHIFKRVKVNKICAHRGLMIEPECTKNQIKSIQIRLNEMESNQNKSILMATSLCYKYSEAQNPGATFVGTFAEVSPVTFDPG